MLITETASMLKEGMTFKVIFTSAFALCEEWKKILDLGVIPKASLDSGTPNYHTIAVPRNNSCLKSD